MPPFPCFRKDVQTLTKHTAPPCYPSTPPLEGAPHSLGHHGVEQFFKLHGYATPYRVKKLATPRVCLQDDVSV